jgi:D-3-phosphoglycerate dehydrogenase
MPLIVVPDAIEAVGIDLLKTLFDVDVCTDLPVAEQRERAKRADGIIVRSFKVDAALIADAPRLKIVSKHGAGTDNIDIAAACEAGVVVANVPGGNSLAVAEGAVGLMLAVLRRTLVAHHIVASSNYAGRRDLAFEQLSNRTLAIVGVGAIGRHVARICSRGFDMKVVGYDPYITQGDLNGLDIELAGSLDEMLPIADIVTLHMPMVPDMRHMIGADRLRAMKRTAVLINTARGPLIDPEALQSALTEGWIAGAALDVFETEPPPPGHPLFAAPNLVLSPHVAGGTHEANRTLAQLAAQNVIDTLAGTAPAGLINAEAWVRRRA